MEDIAPALLEKIRADFQRRVAGDRSLAAILEKIEKGAATYAEANAYADRIEGIVNAISSRETYDKTAEKLLDEPVKLYARNVADETARENAAFQKKAGLKPKIRRTASARCCDWCAEGPVFKAAAFGWGRGL